MLVHFDHVARFTVVTTPSDVLLATHKDLGGTHKERAGAGYGESCGSSS
jgi:hypothetical protein